MIDAEYIDQCWKGTRPHALYVAWQKHIVATCRDEVRKRKRSVDSRQRQLDEKIQSHAIRYADAVFDLTDVQERYHAFAIDDTHFPLQISFEGLQDLTERRANIDDEYLRTLWAADPVAAKAGVFDNFEDYLIDLSNQLVCEWRDIIAAHDEKAVFLRSAYMLLTCGHASEACKLLVSTMQSYGISTDSLSFD